MGIASPDAVTSCAVRSTSPTPHDPATTSAMGAPAGRSSRLRAHAFSVVDRGGRKQLDTAGAHGNTVRASSVRAWAIAVGPASRPSTRSLPTIRLARWCVETTTAGGAPMAEQIDSPAALVASKVSAEATVWPPAALTSQDHVRGIICSCAAYALRARRPIEAGSNSLRGYRIS